MHNKLSIIFCKKILTDETRLFIVRFMFNEAQNKGDIMKYYLNGEQVGYVKAVEFFCNILNEKDLPGELWVGRNTEEGREIIFDVTDGQLEIIAE